MRRRTRGEVHYSAASPCFVLVVCSIVLFSLSGLKALFMRLLFYSAASPCTQNPRAKNL